MINLKRELQRLKETGKIDGANGAENVGLILDAHNNAITDKMDKNYDNEMNARNGYYYKLWQRAVEDIRSGQKNDGKKKKEKTIIHMPPEYKSPRLIVPNKQEEGKVYLK